MSGEHDNGAAKGVTCRHALSGERPVGLIFHHTDGSWDFLCDDDGAVHESVDDIAVICSHCAFEQFVDGLDQAQVSIGYEAEKLNDSSIWELRAMREEAIEAFKDETS